MENFEKNINSLNIEGIDFQFDNEGFVQFGDVARRSLNQQSQYASRYIDGALEEYPNLGDGLKFKGSPSDYHDVKIHKDSIEEFVKRIREYQDQN